VARHPVAANLIMFMIIIAGLVALQRINTQFFPSFELDFIQVQVDWRGASAEDVLDAVTTPLQDALRDVDGLRTLFSVSGEGVAAIVLELRDGTDIADATESVKDRVARVRNLPADARDPTITRIVRYDPIARLLLTGDVPVSDLREIARAMEDELLDRGVANIVTTGVPPQEIRIELDQQTLLDLDLDFQQFARVVASLSRDQPAGDVGEADVARRLRGLDQARTVSEFKALTVPLADGGEVMLGELAQVGLHPRDGSVTLSQLGQPAVQLLLQRAEGEDTLRAAQVLQRFLDERRGDLPSSVQLTVFDEFWVFLVDRINLLVKNGVGGLALVVAIILLFLSWRLAFWVGLGIPVSFLAAVLVLWLVGGSINMISLFGLIMALGIIVDNAIVVSENALARHQAGESPVDAAVNGARQMLVPVSAASLTTVAAFLPLMLIGGPIGNILFAIPLVVVCAIGASIIQTFFILPGHLRRSFERSAMTRPGRLRSAIDGGFNRFRDGPFCRALAWSLDFRATTLAAALATLAIALALIPAGRLPFTFFPAVEGEMIEANVSFVAGTPRERVVAYMERLEQALFEVDARFGGGMVRAHKVQLGSTVRSDPASVRFGDQYAGITVQLVSPEVRDVRNRAFINAWEAAMTATPGLDNLLIGEREAGPPGSPIDVRLTGADMDSLKRASLDLQAVLQTIPGVSGIGDDLVYGSEQWVFTTTAEARGLGISPQELGRQLRAAFGGELVQIFHHRRDEIEVRVRMLGAQRDELGALSDFQVRLPGGGHAPLGNLVDFEARRGFDSIASFAGRVAVRVSADVDTDVNNANRILDKLSRGILPELEQRHGVSHAFEGRAADEGETLADMRTGLLLALSLVYLTLAWVFGSYGWPLLVMSVIPFGLIGAFAGHVVMGLDLTMLSLFGLFGLTGIVVNNSIILVVFYREIRDKDPDGDLVAALIEASRQRLRPVLVTTLTTMGGLLPLIFETSLQAQFLIPMAVSIAFGLGLATVIVLFLVPALLAVYETGAQRIAGWSRGPRRD
jgi:multidrug efflux pump subunit AcrB